jgi:cysteinyl-tRNA synthetase
MTRARIPEAILDAAHARARAREVRDWPEADRLRGEIEGAGWKIVDRGTDFALTPAQAPDVEDAGRVRYGSSTSVPSRLDEAPVGVASVVLVATDWPADLERALSGLREHAPDGLHVVIVANAPSQEQTAILDKLAATDPGSPGIGTEVVWTSERLGHAAALNAGIRRATAPIAIILDSSVEPVGDVVGPLVRALADADVAVAGPWGLVSGDLRHFEEGAPGDVDAIAGYVMAFRRADYAERGPLDEAFRFYRNLDIWWSLVLRDGGEGGSPRQALAVGDMPVRRHDHREYLGLPTHERDRLSKRNFYRLLDRFRDRRDLLVGADR